MREGRGVGHDLLDAILSVRVDGDLVRLVTLVPALGQFVFSDDGTNLLVAYRRAANILKAEEKKDKTTFEGEPDPDALTAPEEKALYRELATRVGDDPRRS